MRYAAFEGGTVIELDTNGDRVADFQIGLDDFVALSFADFRGLQTDASGHGGGSTKTNAMTSRFSFEDGSSTSDQHYAPVMPSNDTWLASNDSLLIYA